MASLRLSDDTLKRFRALSDTRKADRFLNILLDTYERQKTSYPYNPR
jgi:hypothetical protein